MNENNRIFYIMSKYEKAHVIGVRMEQLARGAPSTINVGNMTNIRDIAHAELENRKIPFKIVRTLPNNEKVVMDISEMIF